MRLWSVHDDLGMSTLLQNGLATMFLDDMTLEEVLRVAR